MELLAAMAANGDAKANEIWCQRVKASQVFAVPLQYKDIPLLDEDGFDLLGAIKDLMGAQDGEAPQQSRDIPLLTS